MYLCAMEVRETVLILVFHFVRDTISCSAACELWKILLPQVWQEGLKQTELSEITAHLSPPTFKKLIDPS